MTEEPWSYFNAVLYIELFNIRGTNKSAGRFFRHNSLGRIVSESETFLDKKKVPYKKRSREEGSPWWDTKYVNGFSLLHALFAISWLLYVWYVFLQSALVREDLVLHKYWKLREIKVFKFIAFTPHHVYCLQPLWS